MMRFLFLFLVLLNVLYGLWQLQDGRSEQDLYEAADQPLEGLPELRPALNGFESLIDPLERPPAAILCVSLGVFSTQFEAEQLRQRLLALSIASSVIDRAVADSQDYWLVMPVQGGRSDALERLGALQDKGIDSFIITQGPLANNISLGVFSREGYAAARQAQLEALGYVVRVERQDKLKSEYLVQVASSARRLIDQALLAKLREGSPGLQHQFIPCRSSAD